MRRPKPENQARQDQALAYLREQGPVPRSTGEVAKAVWVVVVGWWEPECRYEQRGDQMVRTRMGCHRHCPKIWVKSPHGPRPDAVATRAALLRLERDGFVERVEWEGVNRIYWRAI